MYFKPLLPFLLLLLLGSCNGNEPHQVAGYVEGENIFLASPYSGVLEKLAVRRGQHVEKGTLLFILDPKPQILTIAQTQGELEQAQHTLVDLKKPRRLPEISAIEAQIEQAKSQIILAELRVARFQTLYNRKVGDKDTLDAAVANLKQQQDLKLQYEANLALAKLGSREDQIKAQQSQVDSLVAKLKEAQWELSQKTIVAPATGVIFDTYYRPGEFVGTQQSVLSLLTPENTRIEFFVSLSYLAQLKVGQKITFDCEGCQPNNKAVISYISPDAEYLPPLVYSRDNDSKLVFRVQAQINDPSLFKPGQPVWVNL